CSSTRVAPLLSSRCRVSSSHVSSSLSFFQSSAAPHHLHSFPTRRSSDLWKSRDHRQINLLCRCRIERKMVYLTLSFLANFQLPQDRKSTRLNSSHVSISYAVFCLKKKINTTQSTLT